MLCKVSDEDDTKEDTTEQTKDTHDSSVGVLMRVHMLQVCVHVKNVALAALRIRVIISVIVNVPTYSLFTCM